MRVKKLLFLALILAAALLAAAQSLTTQTAQAQPGLNSSAAAAEYWKAGITLEDSILYNATAGRLLTESASFRSARAGDVYFVFPASADARTIQSARYMLLERAGGYASTALLSLEIYDFNGNLLRTVSSAPLDMQSAALNQWGSLPLSANLANLSIQPGEFLALHCSFGAGAGGDLEARPIFEIKVE